MVRIPILLLATLLAACASSPTSVTTDEPVREVVQQRLTTFLETDPNRQLCETITASFKSGNRDALEPYFDTASFVERIFTFRTLPPDLVEGVRANHSAYKNFGRFHFPDGSDFLCLGTREFMGQPHVVIRQWTQTRFDYVLLHLTETGVDDYFLVSSGFHHSDLQAHSFDPAFKGSMDIIGKMLHKSYDGDFAGIISDYQALPVSDQKLPIAFFHFINAVFTVEPTGSPLYTAAMFDLDRVMTGRTFTLAYWHRIDANRRGDEVAAAEHRETLLSLLDDYELLSK